MLTLGSVLVALLPGLPLRTGLRPPLGAPSPSVDVRATAARAPQPLLSAYTPYRRAALEVVEGAAPTDHFVFKTNDVVRIDTDEYAIELFRNRTRTDKLVHKFIEKGCGTFLSLDPFLPYVRAHSSHIPPFEFFVLERCLSSHSTHFSHMSHPTFPISHLLFLSFKDRLASEEAMGLAPRLRRLARVHQGL